MACGGCGGWWGGWGGNIHGVSGGLSANERKYLNERDHKIYTASQTMGGRVNFFFPTWKVVPGAYSDQRPSGTHLEHLEKMVGYQVNLFSPTWKVVPGAYSDQRETPGDTWNTPKKWFFCPKEAERG